MGNGLWYCLLKLVMCVVNSEQKTSVSPETKPTSLDRAAVLDRVRAAVHTEVRTYYGWPLCAQGRGSAFRKLTSVMIAISLILLVYFMISPVLSTPHVPVPQVCIRCKLCPLGQLFYATVLFVFLFFFVFFRPQKIWKNRSREQVNGFSWNFYQTIPGKMEFKTSCRRLAKVVPPPCECWWFA